MSSGVLLPEAVLDEVFLAQDITSALSIDASNLYLSLHSAYPLSQTDSEVSYGSYARVPVARTASGWTDAFTASVSNANGLSWPACTSGTATAKYVGIGTAASGSGNLLIRAPIVASGMGWVAAFTNIRATAGTAADWVTVAGYRLGSDLIAEGDELAIMRVYEEAMHTNLLETTAYFVKTGTLEGAWPEAISFQLATVSGGGSLVDISPGDNRCSAIQLTVLSPLSISTGVIPTLPAAGGVIWSV